MKRILPALSLALLLAIGVGGCAAAEFGAPARDEAGPEGGSLFFVADGDCLRPAGDPEGSCLPNPQQCASIEISGSDDQRCETCYDAAGNIISQQCGAVETADCTEHENDEGDICTICQSRTGTIYYDDCHNPDQQTGLDGCETYTTANDEECTICYGPTGEVVSSECYSPGYDCEEWLEGDMLCHRCYEDNSLVSEGCEPLQGGSDIDPAYCDGFASEDGSSCYTCYDEQGNVIEHNCTDPNQVVRCDSFWASNEVYCEVCYDSNGNEVSRSCDPVVPPDEQCYEYRSEHSFCIICYDDMGTMTRRDCEPLCVEGSQCSSDADCLGNGVCAAGGCQCDYNCELITNADGTLCEICGDLNNDGVVDEQDANCFPNPTNPVDCWEEWQVDQSTGDEVLCTVCESATGGRTEDCSGQTTAGVQCEVEQQPDGSTCEVCRNTWGEVVHTTCGGLECHEETVEPLSGDDTSEMVLCQVCEEDGAFFSAACDMSNVCATDSDPDNGGSTPGDPNEPGVDPATGVDACGNLWLHYFPRQCGNNPWEEWWQGYSPLGPLAPQQEGEIIRAYYREVYGIEILAYRVEHAFDIGACDACDCERGDVVFIYVSQADMDALQQLGWSW